MVMSRFVSIEFAEQFMANRHAFLVYQMWAWVTTGVTTNPQHWSVLVQNHLFWRGWEFWPLPSIQWVYIYTQTAIISSKEKRAWWLVSSRRIQNNQVVPTYWPKMFTSSQTNNVSCIYHFFHRCAPANMLASACIELTLGVVTPGCQSNCMLNGYILAILVA